jgi:glycolate oxidase
VDTSVVRDFGAVLGEENVLTEPTESRTRECDGLTGCRVVPR